MNKTHWAIIIAFVATVGVGCILFRVESHTVEHEDTAKSRRNPLLALELFSEAMGVPFQNGGSLEETLPADELAVVLLGDAPTPERLAEKLHTWVLDGGRLWIVRELDPPTGDGIFDLIRMAGEAEREDWEPDPLLESFGLEDRFAAEGAEVISVQVGDETFQTSLNPRRVLMHGDAEELDDLGALAQLEAGEGHVLFVGTGKWLTNKEFGHHENASLVWELLAQNGLPDAIRVLRVRSKLSLTQWALGPGLSFFAVFLLAFAFMIARRGMRLGPVLEELSTERRDFAEHLEATGAFHWRRGSRSGLLQRVRESVAPQAPTGPERRRWLADVAAKKGINVKRLEDAWAETKATDARAFVRSIRTLAEQASENPNLSDQNS